LKYRQSGASHASSSSATAMRRVTQDQRAWRLLAAVACIAFDANANRLSVSHRIIARMTRPTESRAFFRTSTRRSTSLCEERDPC
jgi:hypothetical protein